MFSAQTGISRFLEINRNFGWLYDKNENVKYNSTEMLNNYTHLLVESESQDDPRLAYFKNTHKIIYFVKSFNGLFLSPSSFTFKIKQIPKIFILKKKI